MIGRDEAVVEGVEGSSDSDAPSFGKKEAELAGNQTVLPSSELV